MTWFLMSLVVYRCAGIDGCIGIYDADILRLFRIFRYGDRSCPLDGISSRHKFRFPLSEPESHGVLAAVAYIVIIMVEGLCLHTTGRK